MEVQQFKSNFKIILSQRHFLLCVIPIFVINKTCSHISHFFQLENIVKI